MNATRRSNFIDMTGRTAGRLRVLARVPNHNGRVAWLCVCECGTELEVLGMSLRTGNTRSCGCLHREVMSEIGKRVAPQLHEITRGRYVKDVVEYDAAHLRVKAARGRAADHDCVDCGALAHHWSYDHNDENELTEEHLWGVHVVTMRYSLDINAYSPRCKSCHISFDLTRAKERRTA